MSSLAIALADRRFGNTAKLLIILDALGGVATTGDLVTAGTNSGARSIRGWKISTLLRSASDRVAETPKGWLLLPAGREYLAKLGYKEPGWAGPETGRAAIAVPTVGEKPVIFVGHGRSPAWRELCDFLRDRVGVEVEEFNRISAVGISNKERLSGMLDRASAAILVLTAEDERADGTLAARLNVIHETGLFQGRLGFEKVAILLESSCEEFSNVAGIGQVRFPAGHLTAAFDEIRHFLEREQLTGDLRQAAARSGT